MHSSQQSPFASSSSNLATGNVSAGSQMGLESRDIRYQPVATTSVTSSGHAERIMHHPASMKPVTGVAVSKSIPTTVVHSSMQMGTQGVTSSVQSVRPMTPQEAATTFSSSSYGPRESTMIQEMVDLVASFKIPLTQAQVQEITRMTALRMEGLLRDHSTIYHDDVYATQLKFLKFVFAKLSDFGFSDLITRLREHIFQVFAFKKELVTEITISNKIVPSSVKLMSPRSRTAAFGSRLDAYCLADLLREAAILYTADVVLQYLKGTTTDNNMTLFSSCIQKAIERIHFNSEVDKPALYNFVYNRPSLQTTSVSSLHSSGSVQSNTSARLRRGVSPTSPYSARSPQHQPQSQVGMSSTLTSVQLGESPQVVEVRSPTMPAVVHVPEPLPGASYSSAHVKTYSPNQSQGPQSQVMGSQNFTSQSQVMGSQNFTTQTMSSQGFPTTVTVKVRTTEVTPVKEDCTLIGMATDLLNSRPSSTISQTLPSRGTSQEQDSAEAAQASLAGETHEKTILEASADVENTAPVDMSRATSVSQSQTGAVNVSQAQYSRHEETNVSTTNAVETRTDSHQEQINVPLQSTTVLGRSASHSSTGSSAQANEMMIQHVTALRNLATSTTRYEAPRTNVADLDSSLKLSMANLIETLNGVILEIDDMKKHTSYRLDDVTHNLGEFAYQVQRRIDSLSAKHNRFMELSSRLSNEIHTLHTSTEGYSKYVNETSVSITRLQESYHAVEQRQADAEMANQSTLARVNEVSAQLRQIDGTIQQVYHQIDERLATVRTQLQSEMSGSLMRQSREDFEQSREMLKRDIHESLRPDLEEDRRAMRMHEEDLARFRGQLDEIKSLLNGYNFKSWLEEAASVRKDIAKVREDMQTFNVQSRAPETDHLRMNLSNVDAKVSEHESRLTQLENRPMPTTIPHNQDIQQIRSQMSQYDSRITSLENRRVEPTVQPEIYHRLDHYESRITNLENRRVEPVNQEVHQRLDHYDSRITNLENRRVESNVQDIQQIRGLLGHHDMRLANLEKSSQPEGSRADVYNHEQRIKHLETHNNVPEFVINDIKQLNTTVRGLQEAHSDYSKRLSQLEKERLQIVTRQLDSLLVEGSPTYAKLFNSLLMRISGSHNDATPTSKLEAEIESLRREVWAMKQLSTSVMPPNAGAMHMNSDKIVINSNSPTNIYLNAEHADVTPAYRDTAFSTTRFGAPMVARPALVETTPAKRPGSGSSRHKKSSNKNSGNSPLVHSSGQWVTAVGESPQAATYSFTTGQGGVQTTALAAHTSTSSYGATTHGAHDAPMTMMATSPLHVMTTGGPMVVTTTTTTGPSAATSLPATSLSAAGGLGTVSSHGTSTTTTVPQTTSEVVTLQGSPMQAIYTRGAETGTTYTVERSHVSSVAEQSAVTSGIEGSPLARLSKEKETEQAMLKRLEAHYRAI